MLGPVRMYTDELLPSLMRECQKMSDSCRQPWARDVTKPLPPSSLKCKLQPAALPGTVGFHNFNLRIFNLRVSNPSKSIVYVF